jgi:hypothetical protein
MSANICNFVHKSLLSRNLWSNSALQYMREAWVKTSQQRRNELADSVTVSSEVTWKLPLEIWVRASADGKVDVGI